jgi:hypothetical protein
VRKTILINTIPTLPLSTKQVEIPNNPVPELGKCHKKMQLLSETT